MFRFRYLTLLVAAAVVLLALPCTASAMTAQENLPGNVIVGGSGSAETLVVSDGDGGLLQHNRAGDAGFNSAYDWDSAMAGDQTLSSNGSAVLTVSMLGGNDVVYILGNVGSAGVLGGDGDDELYGSTHADNLQGENGNDRIDPGSGADTVLGGAGDDLIVWNEGDGSDTIDGQVDADTVQVTGSSTLGDTFSAVPNGARTTFTRTNLGLFTLDLGTIERLVVVGLGGDDSFAGGTLGSTVSLDIDGGVGNDTITTGAGSDLLFGGPGNDALTGGEGIDGIDSGDGDDSVNVSDAAADAVNCGAGTDAATLDLLDGAANCETVTKPAGPQPPKAIVTLSKVTAKKALRGKYTVLVPLSCTGDHTCTGVITLTTARTFGLLGSRAPITLARVSYSIPAGTSKSIKAVLPAVSRLVAIKRVLSVNTVAETTFTDGSIRRGTRKIAVVLPK